MSDDCRARPIDPEAFSVTDVLNALPDTGIGLDMVAPREENERRAHFAAYAVHAYAVKTGIASGESVFLAIADLMGDLHHLLDACRRLKRDEGYPREMEDLVDRGFRHYAPEIEGRL